MIKLLIDGTFIAELSTSAISMSLSTDDMRSVESAAQTTDYEIVVEPQDSVNRFFSGEGYLHHCELFNAHEHQAQVLCEQEVVLSGSVVMLSVERVGTKLTYRLRVRREGAAWAINAEDKLIRELEVEYGAILDTLTVAESWVDDSIIKYFPVHRDDYSASSSSVSLETVRRIRSVDEYHPFINIYKLMSQAFAEGGYTLQSEFMESDFFKSLYMSGAYASQYSTEAKGYMDFYVERLADGTSTADYRGRVTMSPLSYFNSVGYIVDYESISEKSECYSLGNCFTVIDSKLTFTPTQAVSVGFEFRVNYTTEYKIATRTELLAFDTLYLEDGYLHNYGVVNRFVDQREEVIQSNFEYLVMVFDESESSSTTYTLKIVINGSESTIGSFTGRSGRVTTSYYSSSTSFGEVRLYAGSTLYTNDWALYMGYIDENGETEVDVTIRTAPENLTSGSPKVFSAPYICGADEDMSVTIKAGTYIKPYFAGYPGSGSWVEFEDLSQHEAQVSDAIESVRHLFNLAIFSDPESMIVTVEPEEEIYDSSVVWDWSDRIVESEAVTFSDVALTSRAQRKWGYQQNDGVTNRTNGFYYVPGDTYPDAPEADPEQSVENSSSPDYGSWLVDVGSYAAESGIGTELNPLFSPTQNDTEGLPIVGDRDNPDMSDTLEFSPRIVSWGGMYESGNESYPHTYFHNEDAGVTLCFEDRDGVEGLNKYYREMVARESSGRYLELTLRLSTSDLISLMTPCDGVPHRLSTFGFRILGEWCEARLESIEAVELCSSKARCKFIIIN